MVAATVSGERRAKAHKKTLSTDAVDERVSA